MVFGCFCGLHFTPPGEPGENRQTLVVQSELQRVRMFRESIL